MVRTISQWWCVSFERNLAIILGIVLLTRLRAPREQTGHRGHAGHRQASHTPRFSAPKRQRPPSLSGRPVLRLHTSRTAPASPPVRNVPTARNHPRRAQQRGWLQPQRARWGRITPHGGLLQWPAPCRRGRRLPPRQGYHLLGLRLQLLERVAFALLLVDVPLTPATLPP